MLNFKEKIFVMLIDDDEDDREVFSSTLQGIVIDVEIIICKNGMQAVEYFKIKNNQIPTIIFLDINMPLMTGIEVLKEIRNNKMLVDLPIAMYSTSSLHIDIEEAFLFGANVYITKPNSIDKLKKILERVLKTNWLYNKSNLDFNNFILSL